MKPIIYSTAAESDQDAALRGYYSISVKLAERLHALIKKSLSNISMHPKAWAPYFEDFRKINLDPFPFAVVYQEMQEIIRIIAIIDLRREPGYWLK